MTPTKAQIQEAVERFDSALKQRGNCIHIHRDYIQAILTALAEAQKDTERLNWLEAQERREMVENKNVTDFLIWYSWMQTHWGKTYREAIDSAKGQDEAK